VVGAQTWQVGAQTWQVGAFVSRMLGKGNIAGLMEKMKAADVDLEKQAPN